MNIIIMLSDRSLAQDTSGWLFEVVFIWIKTWDGSLESLRANVNHGRVLLRAKKSLRKKDEVIGDEGVPVIRTTGWMKYACWSRKKADG
jgi:hypothetical protein